MMINNATAVRTLLNRNTSFPYLRCYCSLKNVTLGSVRRFSSNHDKPNSDQKEDGENKSNDGSSKNGILGSLVTWKSVAIMSLVGGVSWYWFDTRKQQELKRIKEIKSVGTASIGGPFSLVDHNGKPTTDGDFRGKFILIYFGFTHCPDICPAEMQKVAAMMRRMEKLGYSKLVQPLFITIDPWRDSVGKIQEYVKLFHPSIIGLTGTPATITKVCKAFRVYVSKSQGSANPENAEDDDYLVDHSIVLYLLGPDGKFVEFYTKTVTEEQAAEKLANQIRNAIDQGNGEKKELGFFDRITTLFSSEPFKEDKT